MNNDFTPTDRQILALLTQSSHSIDLHTHHSRPDVRTIPVDYLMLESGDHLLLESLAFKLRDLSHRRGQRVNFHNAAPVVRYGKKFDLTGCLSLWDGNTDGKSLFAFVGSPTIFIGGRGKFKHDFDEGIAFDNGFTMTPQEEMSLLDRHIWIMKQLTCGDLGDLTLLTNRVVNDATAHMSSGRLARAIRALPELDIKRTPVAQAFDSYRGVAARRHLLNRATKRRSGEDMMPIVTQILSDPAHHIRLSQQSIKDCLYPDERTDFPLFEDGNTYKQNALRNAEAALADMMSAAENTFAQTPGFAAVMHETARRAVPRTPEAGKQAAGSAATETLTAT
jgi:hypothetical protein